MGTSPCYSLLVILSGDHPHAYGDKAQRACQVLYKPGSSPRVWGQVFHSINFPHDCRIIPTRMGTSERINNEMDNYRDHPHAYGDKFLDTLITAISSGSSPRVWGQAFSCPLQDPSVRIIPTRMGTSGYFCVIIRVVWDHPHAYGDKWIFIIKHIEKQGSSPRVWGQGAYHFPDLTKMRIIPTRMGTS